MGCGAPQQFRPVELVVDLENHQMPAIAAKSKPNQPENATTRASASREVVFQKPAA